MAKLLATINYEVTGDPNSALRAAAEKAFGVVAAELTGRFDAAISGEHWGWRNDHGGVTPRFGASQMTLSEKSFSYYTALGQQPPSNTNRTARAPKAMAGAKRSIVDTGDLKQSRSFRLNKAALRANWTWGVDYAAAVYFGATIHPWGNPGVLRTIPGRPWVKAVMLGAEAVPGCSGIEQYPVEQKLKAYIIKFTRPQG